MSDYLISDPPNIFGLIWSCILKFINFLIFRDFSRIFLNISELFLMKNIKNLFLMRADMEAVLVSA